MKRSCTQKKFKTLLTNPQSTSSSSQQMMALKLGMANEVEYFMATDQDDDCGLGPTNPSDLRMGFPFDDACNDVSFYEKMKRLLIPWFLARYHEGNCILEPVTNGVRNLSSLHIDFSRR